MSTWRLPLTRVVIAPWLAEKGDELGVDTILVPNAIDPTDMPPGKPISERQYSVLALVSVHAWKRTDLVVAVMNRLAATIEGFRGATFGSCPRPDGLSELVSHFENPARADLRLLYQDSQIYLCTSDAEGWHLPPAEAMATGAAVVSTDIEGVRGFAASTAVFAPIGDSDALTDAILDLLGDSDRLETVATRGQAAIIRRGPDDAAHEFMQALFPGQTHLRPER